MNKHLNTIDSVSIFKIFLELVYLVLQLREVTSKHLRSALQQELQPHKQAATAQLAVAKELHDESMESNYICSHLAINEQVNEHQRMVNRHFQVVRLVVKFIKSLNLNLIFELFHQKPVRSYTSDFYQWLPFGVVFNSPKLHRELTILFTC